MANKKEKEEKEEGVVVMVGGARVVDTLTRAASSPSMYLLGN